MKVAERFWSKVDKSGECWLWRGGHNGRGYGRFSVDGRLVYAHRWAYEFAVGPITEGAALDHLCRTPSCVNPTHLEVVAWGENLTRGRLGFGLTGMCRSGLHDMSDAANVYVRKAGGRQCLPCRRSARATYWQEKSA